MGEIRPLILWGLGCLFFDGFCNSADVLLGVVQNATGPVFMRTRPKANQTSPSVTTTTTTQYDALARVVSISYDDGTPEKTFSYDADPGWGEITPTNLKGRLTAAYTPGTTGTIYSYDANGRILQLDECFPSNCGSGSFPISYAYDWAGNVTYEADWVSGGIVYGRSPAGEVTSITNQTYSLTGIGTAALVSNVQNGPFGPLNWQLGNGLTGVRTYDSLGRVRGGWVCNGSSQANCAGGSLLYWFGTIWQGDQLKQLGDGVLNQESNLGYDDLGRLSSFDVTSGRAGSFTYIYDRYGNRWQQNVTAGTGPAPQISFDKATNRINSSGYAYDAAGNLINDGFHTYTYDAEGNVISVDGGATASYVYNALNQRVEVTTAGGSYEYLYDAEGHRISQWLTTNSGSGARIYWGNQVVASRAANGYTYFEGKDWLGTERIRTDASGNAVATYTSLPFGDGNTVSGSDPNAQQETPAYAMLDIDAESDTDHATFRQYSDTQGRWMSPDPYYGSYNVNNPQSMNRYTYVLNDPLGYVDPDGLDRTRPCVVNTDPKTGETHTTCVVEGGDSGGSGSGGAGSGGGGYGGTGGYGGRGGGHRGGRGGGGNGSGRNVNPSFSMTFSCNATPQQLTSAVENNFWQLADFTGTGGALSSYTLFAPASIVPGQAIDIAAGVQLFGGAVDAHNWQVTVENVSPTSFTFNTVQGQHGFYPGAVTFSVAPAGNGQLAFSVNVNATYANWAYWVGGKIYGEAAEGNTWNNLTNNVASFCAATF